LVRGLKIFQRHFQEYGEHYVLIGGAACDLAMETAGLEFRATKDLDIVLCAETLDEKFVKAFWQFLSDGGYRIRQNETGRRQYYRFTQPENSEFPYMLELFSRKPDMLRPAKGSRLTPVHAGKEVESLSAILLDDDYYYFLLNGRRMVDGLPVVEPEHLIPLKAKAWLDLKKRKEQGEKIDSRDVNKHKNDVFRLFRVIDPEARPDTPKTIRNDMLAFLHEMRTESVDTANLGLRETTREEILKELRRFYGIG